MPSRQRRLLTIGHSYCVALNRRLAHELARASGEAWHVTAVAPTFFRADLRAVRTQMEPGEASSLVTVGAQLTGHLPLFFYRPALRRVLAEGWDLVHAWEEPYVVAGGQIAWWCPRRTPIVFFTFQNITKRYPPPWSAIETMCRERCAGWLPAGETVAQVQIGRGWDEKPYRVLPPGVDTEMFRPEPGAGRAMRAELEWEETGAPVVGFLGRFVEEKGIHLLMSALDRISSPWRALFVGAGPLEPTVRRWAAGHGHRVRVLSDVSHDQVSRCLNAMDLLVAPSQTRPFWREQFGRMLIEAFACGVPVIASDSGEIPHVVGEAGMIVGERDEAGWQRALCELLESPQTRAELGERGLQRARHRYAWPVVARQHVDFFEELLA